MAKNKKKRKAYRPKTTNPMLTGSTNRKFDKIAMEKGLVRGSKEYNDYIWSEIGKIEKQLGPEGFARFNQFVMGSFLNGVKI